MGLEGEVAALNLELKWTKITFNLPSKPASASLSEKFYQTDSTYVIVVFRRQISGGSYSNILTETSPICFFFFFSLAIVDNMLVPSIQHNDLIFVCITK